MYILNLKWNKLHVELDNIVSGIQIPKVIQISNVVHVQDI